MALRLERRSYTGNSQMFISSFSSSLIGTFWFTCCVVSSYLVCSRIPNRRTSYDNHIGLKIQVVDKKITGRKQTHTSYTTLVSTLLSVSASVPSGEPHSPLLPAGSPRSVEVLLLRNRRCRIKASCNVPTRLSIFLMS